MTNNTRKSRWPIVAWTALVFLVGWVMATFWSVAKVVVGLSTEDMERARLAAMIAGSCSTLLAVMVALFKEDFRSIWDRAELHLSLSKIEEDLDDSGGERGGRITPVARGYSSRVVVRNTGSQAAKLCEVELNELYEWKKTTEEYVRVDVPSSTLQWIDSDELRIAIPCGRYRAVELVRLRMVGASKGEESVPSLEVGKMTFRKEGKWRAKFTVFSENAQEANLCVEVTWGGVWHSRLTDMSSKSEYRVVHIPSLLGKV